MITTLNIQLKLPDIPGGEGILYYSLSSGKEMGRIVTSYRIYPGEWDARLQRVVYGGGRDSYLAGIQQRIDRDLLHLQQVIGELENKGTYTFSQVFRLFNEQYRGKTMLGCLDSRIRELRERGAWGTARNYSSARNSFADYCAGAPVELDAVTESRMEDYESWLKKRNVTRNTISFYMRILRAVYNKAVREHLTEQAYPFGKVYTGIERTRKRAVEEDIIVRLKNTDLTENRPLELTRDLFLFSFYTRGMAFVDMAYLKKRDVSGGLIHYARQKTGQRLHIRLEKCMSEIIRKYSGSTSGSVYLLPILSASDPQAAYREYQNALSYYNKQLKKLSRRLELDRPLTSYTARHTWATLARKKNIPVSVICEGMGHSDEATTRIYLASLDQSVIDDANKVVIGI